MGGHKRRLGHGLLANAGAVDKGLMRQVHQVVDDQPVVALHRDQLAVAGPGRVVVPVHVGHQGRVGLGRVTGPDPDKAVFLHHRVAAHAGRGVDRLLAGHVGAAPLGVVNQAVVAAGDLVTLQAAHRERQQPVPAGVFQHGHAAIGFAKQHHLLLANGACQQLLDHLHIVGGGVPGIQGEDRFVTHNEYELYTLMEKIL